MVIGMTLCRRYNLESVVVLMEACSDKMCKSDMYDAKLIRIVDKKGSKS